MKHIETDNQKEESALKSFGHALLYSAVEQPYEGLAQIVNHMAQKEVCPPQALTAAPVPAKFKSANWYAQTVGGAIGTAADFIVLSRLLGPSSSAAMTQAERLQGLSTMRAVGVGFVQQGIFAPSQGDHMWAGRVKNGLTGAITVAALKSLSEGLNGASRSAAGITTPGLQLPLGEKIANDMIAGSVAGGLSAETHSLLYGHGNARWEDIVHGSYSFAIVGGAMGAGQTGRSISAAKVDNYVSSTAYEAEASPLRSTLFTSLSRTQAEILPSGLKAAEAAMPRTVLGLPNKNLDLGVWQPAERSDLVTLLRARAAGPLAGEKQVTTFIRAMDEAGVDQAGKELGSLRQLKANTTGTGATQLDTAISAKNTELAQKLEQAINQTSTQTSLKVVLDAGLPANVKGGYQPGFGKLVLNEALFHKGLTAESVDYTAHELTHFDLDVIRLRAAIERHGNASDTTGITKAYGHQLSKDFLTNVRTLGSGKPLEASQLQRLQDVDASVKDYESGPGTTDIMRVDKLFAQIAGKPGNTSPARSAQLKETVNNLYTIRNTAIDRYIGAQFESEAWATGVLAHIKARALGLPEASQDPSIYSH